MSYHIWLEIFKQQLKIEKCWTGNSECWVVGVKMVKCFSYCILWSSLVTIQK